MQAHDFRFCFTPLNGVLFTFPSRYWFAVGHRRVLSLGGWSPRIRTEFHVFRPTRDSRGPGSDFAYRTVTVCGRTFQIVPLSVAVPQCGSRNPDGQAHRFGLVRVRSPLLAESRLMSFPPATEMFQFAGCRSARLCIRRAVSAEADGLPHSETPGSERVCRSPGLIAACRVLRRLPVPRHPSCALFA